MGYLFGILTGLFASLQNTFSSRVSASVGNWGATVISHGVGFITALICMFTMGGANFSNIGSVNKMYLFAGVLGVGLMFFMIKTIGNVGIATATAIVVIAQLLFSTIIESFGLFGMDKVPFDVTKVIGMLMMIGGIIVFKIKG